ncbi:CYFA0S08e00914g1_1 [Cyberlindnera fabianii]|uniref:CYFA0S08e00914g1_1 n=1 Tax=Cyberlindnera fabianii TaxID=36022 RepID=A0A061AW32_CYBFA|nr:Translation machinery-associated protein 17 [Cyberlindnera fabianii]CDR41863.1 CYFA0S08e00914g1_1 [Cyberlindnera fabianii]
MSTIKRPIQIEEFIVTLRQVQDDELYQIKKMIVSYIAKLNKTNTKLDKLVKGEEMDDPSDEDDDFDVVAEDDKELFKDIINENLVVVRNYEERIEAVDNELQHRGLPRESSGVIELPADHEVSQGLSIPSVKESIDTDNNGIDNNAPNSLFL